VFTCGYRVFIESNNIYYINRVFRGVYRVFIECLHVVSVFIERRETAYLKWSANSSKSHSSPKRTLKYPKRRWKYPIRDYLTILV